MATRQDFQMLNDALGNLGNSFVINRQMEQQAKERELDRDLRERMLQEQIAGRELDRDLRERMLQEQIAGRKDAAAVRSQGHAKSSFQLTKPDGTSMPMEFEGPPEFIEAHVNQYRQQGIKVEPLPKGIGPVLGTVHITQPNGTTVIPYRNEQEREAALALQSKLGQPKPPPKLTPVDVPGFKGALTPGGSYVAPDAERMSDVDKAELATLNRSLSGIDAETRKLAEQPSGDRARAVNTQRQQLEDKKTALVGKYRKGDAAGKGAAKKPTRQQAAEYVQKYGSQSAAIQALTKDGFDPSGYAD